MPAVDDEMKARIIRLKQFFVLNAQNDAVRKKRPTHPNRMTRVNLYRKRHSAVANPRSSAPTPSAQARPKRPFARTAVLENAAAMAAASSASLMRRRRAIVGPERGERRVAPMQQIHGTAASGDEAQPVPCRCPAECGDGGRWADAQLGVVLRGAVPRGCGPCARSLPGPLISAPPKPPKSP